VGSGVSDKTTWPWFRDMEFIDAYAQQRR